MINSSPQSILKSEEEGTALIEEAALKVGVELIKKTSPKQPAPLDVSTQPSLGKRSFDRMIFDETLTASGNPNSLPDLPDVLPRKRWSGLDPKLPKPPQAPSKKVLYKRLTYLTRPTDRLASSPSPTLSLATARTDTASIYIPSTAPPTESLDRDSLCSTPTLSPAPSTESEFFSANSVVSSIGGEDDEASFVQEFSTPASRKNSGAVPKDVDITKGKFEIPLLAYRAFSNLSHGYNSDAHFISGLYQNARTIPPCPNINDIFYISEAEKHVGKNPSSTPFISVSSTPLRALMLAFGFLRRKSCKGSYVAIINLKILKEAGIIQKAKHLNLRPVVKYFPANEFLVWGEIKSEAIISVINITDLLKSPPCHPYDSDPLAIREISKRWKAKAAWKVIGKVNKENKVFLSCCIGFAVGQFPRIMKLPGYCLESAVNGIVQDWGLTCSKHERWEDNKIFCEFVRKGYDGVDIGPALPDPTNTMIIRVKEEEMSPLPDRSPIIILSDNEAETEVRRHSLVQNLHQESAIADLMCIDERGLTNSYDSPTDHVFATLPSHYEMEMEIDKMYMRHETIQEVHQLFALLPAAYELEMEKEIDKISSDTE